MAVIYVLLILSIVAVIGVQLYWIFVINRQRRDENDIDRQDVTMFDVRELLMEGEKELAIKVYQDLFDASDDEARREVEAIERSLNI